MSTYTEYNCKFNLRLGFLLMSKLDTLSGANSPDSYDPSRSLSLSSVSMLYNAG